MSQETVKYIFFDNNKEHRNLAEDIVKNSREKYSIIFVGIENTFTTQEWKEFQFKTKAEVIASKDELLSVSEKQIKSFFNSKKTNFFFISKNADRNVSLSFLVMNAAKRNDIAFDKFSMFIAPNWEDVETFLKKRQEEMMRHFDIKLVNPPRLASYILSKKIRPVDSIEFDSETLVAKSDFNIAVVGFSINSREAMFKTYQQGRFEGSNFVVDIIDVSASAKFNSFAKKYSGFVKDSKINLTNLNSIKDLDGIDFSKYNLVIVDLEDELETVNFTKKLQEKFLDSLNISTTIAPFVEGQVDSFISSPNVISFGDVKSVYSVDAIIADSFTQGGHYVNDYYNSTKLDSFKIRNWVGLSDFERGSNVSVADFNYSFVKLIGRETFKNFTSRNDLKAWLLKEPKKYETLARIEHLRWCAYLYSNGWDTLPLEDDIMVENKDNDRKLHTCLVSFDELKSVSDMFREDYQKYDRDNVDIIFDIFKTLNR